MISVCRLANDSRCKLKLIRKAAIVLRKLKQRSEKNGEKLEKLLKKRKCCVAALLDLMLSRCADKFSMHFHCASLCNSQQERAHALLCASHSPFVASLRTSTNRNEFN